MVNVVVDADVGDPEEEEVTEVAVEEVVTEVVKEVAVEEVVTEVVTEVAVVHQLKPTENFSNENSFSCLLNNRLFIK